MTKVYYDFALNAVQENDETFYLELRKEPINPYGGKDIGVTVKESRLDAERYWTVPYLHNGKVRVEGVADSDAEYTAMYFIEDEEANKGELRGLGNVNHPSHYQTDNGIEVIDVIEAFTKDLRGVVAFDIGNALKYLCRWRRKGGVEDLKKAKWYIDHVIEKEEGDTNGK